jgi:hypothetical protein
MGQALRPPPEAVAALAPDLHPDLTTRERVTLQTQPTTCMTCHQIINPLGFALERFDAVGRYRETEHGKPVDGTGSYRTRSGEQVAFDGARQLAEFVAESEEVHTGMAAMSHDHTPTDIRTYRPNTGPQLAKAIHKCIEPDVNRRCESMEVLLDMIRGIEHVDAT